MDDKPDARMLLSFERFDSRYIITTYYYQKKQFYPHENGEDSPTFDQPK